MAQQFYRSAAAALLIAVMLVTPAAAGRQLLHIGKGGGKGPRYVVLAPSVAGAFYQQRTYMAPAPAPVPVTYVQQRPVVASVVQTSQPMYSAQQPVVAAQPTIVAAQPTVVAAQPTIVAAGPHKANLGVDVNMAVGELSIQMC